MKKLLGIIAVVLAIATSAFTVDQKADSILGNNYKYDLYGFPDQDDPINLTDPANYSMVSSLSCPVNGSHRCGVINATDDGTGRPDFTKSFTVIKRN